MDVPDLFDQKRKKVSGLKMPRQFTPRLPGASTKGQAPVNPFSGNKMKVASLSSFREAQLIKTASAEDVHLYYKMCKLADTGDALQIRMFLAQHPEMEKDAGIIGHGFRLLSKGLGRAGTATGSTTLAKGSAAAAGRAEKSYLAAATRATERNAAMAAKRAPGGSVTGYSDAASKTMRRNTEAARRYTDMAAKQRGFAAPAASKAAPVVKPATGAPATGAATKTAPATGGAAGGTPAAGGAAAGGAAQNFANMSDDALKAAAEGGDEAAKRALAKRLGNPVEAAASPLIANSTLGKAIVGTAAAGTLGAVGYGGYKGTQRGKQQNLQQQGRGFNYGM